MAENTCPTACHDKIESAQTDIKMLFGMSIPVWVRGIFIGLLGFLFVLYAGLWAYASTEFATKAEVKDMRSELRLDMKDMNEKLDLLLQRIK